MKSLLVKLDHNSHSEVFDRCRPYLEYVGWKAVDDGPHDAIICHQWHIEECLKISDKPIFVLEKIDGTQLTGPTRKHISNPQVRRIIKGCMLTPRSLYNEHDGRYHVRLMTGETIKPEVPISGDDLKKIVLGYGFGSFHRVQQVCDSLDETRERDISVFFAGTVDYDIPCIDEHRKEVARVVEKIPGSVAVFGRTMKHPDYVDHLNRSWCVACPWGYGESTLRQYEAQLMGALAILPDSVHGPFHPSSQITLAENTTWITAQHTETLNYAVERAKKTHERTMIAREKLKVVTHPETISFKLSQYFNE